MIAALLTQNVVDVYHVGKHYGKLEDIKNVIAQKFKAEPSNIVLYGFHSRIGGDRTTGFACVYKSQDALKFAEPEFRQIRIGVKEPKKALARKSIKTAKNKAIKKFGTHEKKAKKSSK